MNPAPSPSITKYDTTATTATHFVLNNYAAGPRFLLGNRVKCHSDSRTNCTPDRRAPEVDDGLELAYRVNNNDLFFALLFQMPRIRWQTMAYGCIDRPWERGQTNNPAIIFILFCILFPFNCDVLPCTVLKPKNFWWDVRAITSVFPSEQLLTLMGQTYRNTCGYTSFCRKSSSRFRWKYNN